MTAALVVEDVTHRFGALLALDRFSLTVMPGEVVAMIGLNGAGKTTAMRVLTGRLRPLDGGARVLGEPADRLTRRTATRFGHVVDSPLVYPELTVRENLRCAATLHGLPAHQRAAAARRVIDELHLDPWADARARSLSAGNRQRLGVAAAVVHTPLALVLDEPTSALDPRGVVLVRALVRRLAADGAAVLVSSHHLDEVSRVADRIVVVHAGRVVAPLPPGTADLEQQFFSVVLREDENPT